MGQPILTIAVPTYNRRELLDLCLSQLVPQVRSRPGEVELLVSDNGSTDGTRDLVDAYLASGVPLRYIQNESNLGPDRNFAQCFAQASGKFILLLGDDDVLLDGALEKLLPVLRNENPGVVHVKTHAFREDFRAERPKRDPSGNSIIYSDPKAFAARVNVNFTFISANVVNKSLVDESLRPEDFLATGLVQLSWTLSAVLNAQVNIFLDDLIVAAKVENTGGYQLCRVFGVNMNRIFKMFEDKGADPEFFRIVNRKTITTFFPGWILKLRARGGAFQDEDYFETLRPDFRGFPTLWTMVWPVSKWPVPLAKIWFKLCRSWLKLIGHW